MNFGVEREHLLKPLQALIGIVEKRQTKPILANVLLRTENQSLILTTTDSEIELVAKVAVDIGSEDGQITVPARKLLDIVRNTTEGSSIRLIQESNRVLVTSGRSRFSLSMLPAADFPKVKSDLPGSVITIAQNTLASLLRRTYFAMAQQDVRYFLNGMLLSVESNLLRAVATDGHRLSLSIENLDTPSDHGAQVIVPRKAIIELLRLLNEQSEDQITLTLSSKHMRVSQHDFIFTTNLLDGRYPEYQRVIPPEGGNVLVADKHELKQALLRTAILSNEKFRGVRLQLTPGELHLVANNPEQEEAEDTISVDYQGDSIEIGFNVSYLLDVINVIAGDQVKMSFQGKNTSALIYDVNDTSSKYVVMPIRI